jgi:hypothetical protein
MNDRNRGYIYRARAATADAGQSVLAFHVARFRHFDEAEWRAAIDLGRVLVNGRRAAPEQQLAAGDELEFHRPPWDEPYAPERFDVAFEDDHVLVVVKPPGLQVLPAGPFSARTLLALVRGSDAMRARKPRPRIGSAAARRVSSLSARALWAVRLWRASSASSRSARPISRGLPARACRIRSPRGSRSRGFHTAPC